MEETSVPTSEKGIKFVPAVLASIGFNETGVLQYNTPETFTELEQVSFQNIIDKCVSYFVPSTSKFHVVLPSSFILKSNF